MILVVSEPGRRLESTHEKVEPWKGEPGTRFRWDLSTRRVEYRIGPRKMVDFAELQKRLNGMRRFLAERPLSIEARAGVTAGEALTVLDALRGLGVRDVRLVAAE